jgi:hypothetical protein
MSTRRCLLCIYRLLLWLYPAAFRERFAGEMLEFAEAAEPDEWPLIFGDTGLGIVRCWLEPSGTGSTVQPAGQPAYLALGASALTPARLFLGLALSTAIILSLCYFGSLGYVDLPKCHAVAAENISR